MKTPTNQKAPRHCVPEDIFYTTIPPQSRCKICFKYWQYGDETPFCDKQPQNKTTNPTPQTLHELRERVQNVKNKTFQLMFHERIRDFLNYFEREKHGWYATGGRGSSYLTDVKTSEALDILSDVLVALDTMEGLNERK